MCALFGWLDYKGIIPKKLLKKLTQALANAAEERGTDYYLPTAVAMA